MSTSPSQRRRDTARAVVVAVLVLAGAAGVAASAGAVSAPGPTLGGLHLDPPTGVADQANLRLTTVSTGSPAGCPSTSPRYSVRVTGPGRWSSGVQFAGGTATSGAEIDIPMSPTFAGMASSMGAPLEPGRYELQVTCTRLGQSQGSFTGAVWFTDAQHYQSTDPATTTTVTGVTVTDEPGGRSELGDPVTLKALVVPTTAVGAIQFLETVNDSPLPYGAPVRVVDGAAQIVVKDFTFGLHLMSAQFVPDNTKRFTGSISPAPELAHVVAKPIPPQFTAAPLIRGSAATVGAALTCMATVERASEVTFAWLLSGQEIQGATGSAYTTRAADKSKPLTCRVTGANAGGGASAVSAPVTVGAG